MNRLAIAREDPMIRESIPSDSFRSKAQARQEIAIRQMLAVRKQQQLQLQHEAAPGLSRAQASPGAKGVGSAGSARPAGSMGGLMGGPAGAYRGGRGRVSGLTRSAPPSTSPMIQPSGPNLPFVYRRASFDIQITDPASNDILMLDRGTWVLSAAHPHPVTNMLQVFTTEQETGKVLVYELPVPEGNMSKFFDRHTLNVVETMADEGVGEGVDEEAGDDELTMATESAYSYGH